MTEPVTEVLELLTLPPTCGVSIIMYVNSGATYEQIRHPQCLAEFIGSPAGVTAESRFYAHGAKVVSHATGKRCDYCGGWFQ